ncbi:hypothetical protein BCO26_0437 [Heyndrickxia coagulans 2-6]|nr:hypothetical protein BCO26_0437 [Heyndrickxia coagulans 2-6]
MNPSHLHCLFHLITKNRQPYSAAFRYSFRSWSLWHWCAPSLHQ